VVQVRHTAFWVTVTRAASTTLGITAPSLPRWVVERGGGRTTWRLLARPDAHLNQAALAGLAVDCGSVIVVARIDHASRARHLLPVPLHFCESTYGVNVRSVNSTIGGYPGTIGDGGTGCTGATTLTLTSLVAPNFARLRVQIHHLDQPHPLPGLLVPDLVITLTTLLEVLRLLRTQEQTPVREHELKRRRHLHPARNSHRHLLLRHRTSRHLAIMPRVLVYASLRPK
jgi:hypothetical protein